MDAARKRIGLTMRKDGGTSAREDRAARSPARGPEGGPKPPKAKPVMQASAANTSGGAGGNDSATGAFGAALRDAMKRR